MDYSNEPINDYLMIDMKSFYASVECVQRGLNPLTTLLVVMSTADNTGAGLILSASPLAKKRLHITNVSRARDLPTPLPKDLIIANPRMNLYIQQNLEINAIFKHYVADEDLLIYSIDESILKITKSLKLFTHGGSRSQKRNELAKQIQKEVLNKTGIYGTVGIGDNPLLAKLALDNEAKHNQNFRGEWTYQDVPTKVWSINELTDFWGIGTKTANRLNQLGIQTIKDLATCDPFRLKQVMGIIGLQLYHHANGIDRTDIAQPMPPTKEKSFGNSQVLPKDYTYQNEIELVIKEMAEQVAIRIRKQGCKTQCVHLAIGTSFAETKKGFAHQIKIPPTDQTKELQAYCIHLFRKYYIQQEVRQIAVSYGKLVYTDALQLNLFDDPMKQIENERLDHIIDKIRNKYGFTALVHASSKLEGARSIARSSLVGGHNGGAGGNGGLLHDD